MKKRLIILSIGILLLVSCTKSVDNVSNTIQDQKITTEAVSSEFVKYTIQKGQQYCDKSTYQAVKYDQLSFVVKFDSSAIYKTTDPNNQNDINKLFGFSDNNAAHHDYSARFGWRWSDNALRLFAYIYNNSVVSYKEIGTVAIGSENYCSIKVSDSIYTFTLNKRLEIMPRASKTVKGEGYKLYPYFGGDETAPHTISIWIKEL